MLNSCDFQGRFAADPELRTTQTGKQVASFRMAVDRDMVDANGHRPTDWLTFTAWGKTAEFVSRYFRKGSAAVVHSRCQTRQYEDKNHSDEDAVFIGAFVPASNPLSGLPDNCLVMATEGGGIYVAVKQDKVEIKGDVEVQGKVKVRDDVIAKTISLVNHKHTDSRNGNTSAPLP